MHGSKLDQQATEAYAQAFTAKILDQFFEDKEGISGQEIISVTPIKQVNFFILKVLFEQWQEETKKFRSPFFNYRNNDVNQALKNLVNTLSKNILIGKEDFAPLMQQATSETLHLLYDPENYYLQQAEKLSKNKDIRAISKYVKLFKPLFEDIVQELPGSGGNLSAAVSSAMISAQINEEERQQTIDAFDSIETLDILAQGDPKKAHTTEEINVETEFASFDDSGESINGHDAPLDDKMKQEFAPLEKTPEDNINDQFAESDAQTVNELYEQQEVRHSVASKKEVDEETGITATISINQRYMFLSDLFHGNETDYIAALDSIDNSNSFDDSVEFLVQNFAKTYEWDMNSDEVKEFLKIIFKRFR